MRKKERHLFIDEPTTDNKHLMTTTFEALPEELVARILAAVPCIVRARNCALVCSTWHRLVGDQAAMGRPCVAAGWHLRCTKEVGVHYYHTTLIDNAAAAGHVHCLNYADERQLEPTLSVACLLAAFYGHADALRWLTACGRPYVRNADSCDMSLSEAAIRGGNVACLDHVLSLGIALDRDRACAIAVAAGHVAMLAHLRAKGCAWTDDICRQAADHGSVECLAYAHRSGLSLDSCGVHHAIRWHRNDVVKYLWAHKHPPTIRCMNVAAQKGNLECLAYAHKSGIGLDACDWERVMQRDNAHIIRYACAHGWTSTALLATAAVRAGRMEMVQCLVEHGCRPNANTLAAAAKSRSIRMVQYLVGIGCPWDERVCAMAVQAVDVVMLRYAHSNGCPWNIGECRSLLSRIRPRERGRPALARYLDAHSTCTGGQCTRRQVRPMAPSTDLTG
ncbi:ankyrin repeat protein [Pandoravirus inopinatum]|uniref:Ankyrin repeat protein n=1 Tax=Pandoravirus inopinatum TaxID=1605721 RepID=A0A0B5IXF3_9VIRU|nr:ankyrin repeat protein [Pandoravirus inopinatum]AJF97438.1 ankyrin repeat protein [Pandoravirus inopinatum]